MTQIEGEAFGHRLASFDTLSKSNSKRYISINTTLSSMLSVPLYFNIARLFDLLASFLDPVFWKHRKQRL